MLKNQKQEREKTGKENFVKKSNMGAKRKKAAKKKKDKNPNTISTSATADTPNGNGDLKIQGSDCSSFRSPASQDNNQSSNPFHKREKAENDSQDDNEENQRIVTNDEKRNETFDSLKTIENLDIGDVAVEHHNGAKVSNNGTKQNDEPQDVQKNSGSTKPLIDSVDAHRSVPGNKTISQFEGASVQNVQIAETNKPMREERHSPSVVDPNIKENQDTMILLPEESSKEPSGAVDAALTETADKILPPKNVPFSETSKSNGVRPRIDVDTTNHSENQPLLALSAKPVQKTSWKGCCGIFEVLSSSDR